MTQFLHYSNPGKKALVLFQHAGSMSSHYVEFVSGTLKENYDIYIYQTPPVSNWIDLVSQAKSELLEIQAPEIHILGHSMGGLLAYSIVSEIVTSQLVPKNLFLSAINYPTNKQIQYYKKISNSSEQDFLQLISDIGGTPKDFLTHAEAYKPYIEILRRDFHLLSTITPEFFTQKTKSSIFCLLGNQDNIVSTTKILKWKQMSSTGFSLKAFNGGHFYLFENAHLVQPYLLEQIES